VSMVSLRERNRTNAKVLVQRTGLALFYEHGFDEVTVGRIADAAGMAASSVYRHFPTKEDIVLWDEHDEAIDEALTRQLKKLPPLQAMRTVFVETLGHRYDADIEFQLQRIKYIYATEQIHAAAIEADLRNRIELSDGLRHALGRKNRDAAPILAGAALLAVDVAVERWQANDANKPLSVYLNGAFDALTTMATIGLS
jgi:AcrR family transcriptional regulator